MQVSLLFYYILSFLSGMFSLCLSRKHIMMSLLSLELMILSLFCCYCFMLSMMMTDYYMLMIFLTFGVCEGVVGLSCLVMMIRSHGNDNLMSMTLMTC
uniref:NADH-ubiquinone oxidoreductase chain 4L n=1 Tax=Diceroprocta semicincta TaxID=946270 RepID=A0A088DPA8_9HEMI|nr:NADH dehydrogenase subunit 4L [Diceroprocta semicincta]